MERAGHLPDREQNTHFSYFFLSIFCTLVFAQFNNARRIPNHLSGNSKKLIGQQEDFTTHHIFFRSCDNIRDLPGMGFSPGFCCGGGKNNTSVEMKS